MDARSDLLHAEDEDLGQGEQQRHDPRPADQHVNTARRPRVVEHRVTDGPVAVERRDDEDVR